MRSNCRNSFIFVKCVFHLSCNCIHFSKIYKLSISITSKIILQIYKIEIYYYYYKINKRYKAALLIFTKYHFKFPFSSDSDPNPLHSFALLLSLSLFVSKTTAKEFLIALKGQFATNTLNFSVFAAYFVVILANVTVVSGSKN